MNMRSIQRNLAALVMAALLLQVAASLSAQQAPQAPALAPPPANQGRIRVTTELVLVNVVARDKKGNLVRDLKREHFTVLEDGQKQQVSSFDFENVDELALAGQTAPTATGSEATANAAAPPVQPSPVMEARDRRLILLFFDFSAM